MRFTMTRAVSGLSGSMMASASSIRPLPFVKCLGSPFDRIEAKPRGVTSPRIVSSPRIASRMSCGLLRSLIVWRNGYCGGNAFCISASQTATMSSRRFHSPLRKRSILLPP